MKNTDWLRLLITESISSDATARPRLLPRVGGGLKEVVNFIDLERLLPISGVSHMGLCVLRESDGLRTPSSFPLIDPATRCYSPPRVLEQFMIKKGTVLFSRLQHRLPSVYELLQSLAEVGQCVSQVVALLSPSHGQATVPHADDHPIITVQLYGAKKWEIWDRFSEALIAESGSVQRLEQLFYQAANGKPSSLVMEPGDVLCVPSRFIHTAVTGGSNSLSISFQLTQHLRGHDRREDACRVLLTSH